MVSSGLDVPPYHRLVVAALDRPFDVPDGREAGGGDPGEAGSGRGVRRRGRYLGKKFLKKLLTYLRGLIYCH